MVTQQVVVLLSWVQFPLATPRKKSSSSGLFTWPRGDTAFLLLIGTVVAATKISQSLLSQGAETYM